MGKVAAPSPFPVWDSTDREILKAGLYECTLGDIEVRDDITSKYDDEGSNPTRLIFKFTPVDSKHSDGSISSLVRASYAGKSNCIKLLKQLSGGKLPVSALKNHDTIWAYINTLVGKTFNVTCNVSEDGNWNNVAAVSPVEPSAVDTMEDLPF